MNAFEPLSQSASTAPDDTRLDRTETRVRNQGAVVEDRTAWRMRVLEDIAEIGVELTRAMQRRVLEAEDRGGAMPADAAAAFALGYQRISKAVRQTLMLHARFEDDARLRAKESADETAVRLKAEAAARQAAEARVRDKQRNTAKRVVRQAINTELDARERPDAFEILDSKADDDDFFDDYSDFGRRSIGEIVASICRDLEIPFNPALWKDEPWAIAEIAAKPPGSPFADWPPASANDDGAEGPGVSRAAVGGCGPP